MTTKQMDCILELARTLNFNRAAENLFISQPTMTYQVSEAEGEIGFRIFERSGRGAVLTPAGRQFVAELKEIRQRLKKAVEQGQNFSARYLEDIRIALPIRSAVCLLPDAIRRFSVSHPAVSVTPWFGWDSCISSFLNFEQDIAFAMRHELRRVPNITIHPLFDSRIYLITDSGDELAGKALVTADDLKGRTLMVGGGSPPVLRQVQQRVIDRGNVSYFNSHDHDTTLTNVEAGRGVCLAPGFLNDRNPRFAWIPFDCREVIPCVLCTHKNDRRDSVHSLIRTIQALYQENPAFPV